MRECINVVLYRAAIMVALVMAMAGLVNLIVALHRAAMMATVVLTRYNVGEELCECSPVFICLQT